MEKKEILQLELQNARNLIEKFNSKYEDLDIEIIDDGDLKRAYFKSSYNSIFFK